MAGKFESASSETSTHLTRRLDALEKSIDAKLAAIASPAGVQPHGPTLDLNGKWEVTLSSGAKLRSPIIQLGDGRYRITKMGVFSGIYELKNDRLVVVEPVDKRLTEFVWKVQDADNMVLIESSTKTGQDYSGATLKRIP